MELFEKESYVSFALGNESFAINVKNVLEVFQNKRITPIPKAPAYILGVTNFRGNILPVFDMTIKLKLHNISESSKKSIIVLEFEKEQKTISLGLLTDGVKDVIEITENEILEVPTIDNNYNPEILDGMIKVDDDFIMLLNVYKLFELKELTQLEV